MTSGKVGLSRWVLVDRRRHLYPQTVLRWPPFGMGYDVVGEIDQVREGVSGFRIGDCVADMRVIGADGTVTGT